MANGSNMLAALTNSLEEDSDLPALMGRSDVPDDTQNELQELAKSVSRAVANGINAARKSAEEISDPHDQLQVAIGDSSLTATTNEFALESLRESVERVQESIHRLLEKATNCDQVWYEVGPMEKEFGSQLMALLTRVLADNFYVQRRN
ncbi:hypothetical protein BJ741DRAFT_671525 [Chytriomyces cf. hyalinus JEL632]|nr:hypothetical protein BJ741DRAFT_671525 [Chytriomyces cf. hyalinus JEL632]